MSHPFASATREVAPMLAAPWGRLAPTIAAMIVARPDLGRRLALASPRVFHAIAAFVHAALDAQATPGEIAVDVETTHVRELLARAVPSPHERLFTTLERLGHQVRPLNFYRDLNAGLQGPAAAVLLDAKMIDTPLMRIAARLAADPVLFAARHAVGSSESQLDLLTSALAFVRAAGLARDIEEIPPKSSWRAVCRRIEADLGRACAPAPPFRAPEGWRLLATLSDAWNVGREMGNCMRGIGFGGEHYVTQVLNGETIFLVTETPPRVLVAVRKIAPRLWQIEEFATARNEATSGPGRPELEKALNEVMARQGHFLIARSVDHILSSVGWVARGSEIDEVEDDVPEAA